MKLNLFFMLIDLLVILSIPFVFVWSILTRLSTAVGMLHASRRYRRQPVQSQRD